MWNKIKFESPELLPLLSRVEIGCGTLDEYAARKLQQKQDDFLTMQILGEQGSGKSGVGQFFAIRYADIPFTADRISLHYDGFLELVASSLRGHFSILDEQTKTFGTGSNRLRGDIINIIETLRQHGASIILISPTEKMVSEHDVHITIEVLGMDNESVLLGWKRKSERFIGVFIIELHWNNAVWLEYMKLKRRYVQDAKELKFAKNDYEKLAEKVMEHPDLKYCKTMKDYILILEKEMPNLTVDEKKLVVAQVKLNQRKE